MKDVTQSLIKSSKTIKNKNIYKYLFIISLVIGMVITLYFTLNNIKSITTHQIIENTQDNSKLSQEILNDIKNDTDTMNIVVQKKINDYAFCRANITRGEGGGTLALIVKKTDGVWETVWGGQGCPEDSVVQEYQIPKDIYDECL